MASSLPSLRYVLPITQFAVTVTPKNEVVSVKGGSAVAETTEVLVGPQVVPDHNARCEVTIQEDLLEKLQLTVSLSEEGILEAIGSKNSRDLSPIISLAAKLVPLVLSIGTGGFAGLLPVAVPPTLEEAWRTKFDKLATAHDALAARIQALLEELTDDAPVSDITKIGAALQSLRSELALIDRFRREWIAGHANQSEPQDWTFTTKDMLPIRGENRLPTSYPVDEKDVPEAMRPLFDAGVVVAIADPDRNWAEIADLEHKTTDRVWIRQSRPVEVGVYERPLGRKVISQVSDVDSSGRGLWALKQSMRLDVVDGYSRHESISFHGEWFRERNVQLGFYPDHSIKSYGVTSESTLGAVAASVGSVVDAATGAQKTIANRPSAAQRKLEEGNLRLDLLKTSSEWAQLSATQERAAELAELEQQVRLEELRKKV